MRYLPLCLALGCTAAPRPPAPIVAVEVRETERRSPGLMDAASELIEANVGALVHLDRVREHPTTFSIARLGGYEKLCEDAGLDPIFDVDRFFVAAVDLGSCRETIVLRHHLSPARVDEVFERLAKNSKEPAAHITGLGTRAIAVKTRERPQVVFAPRPDHLVLIPRDAVERAGAFMRALALPPPQKGEAWAGWGSDGGWPLLGKFVPGLVIPSASIVTYLGERHVMRARAHAVSPAAAKNNAAILQRMTDSVLRMPLIGAMLLDPIDFHVDDGDVVTEISLRPAEHQWLLAQMDEGCW
jgi:hypothetical protein